MVRAYCVAQVTDIPEGTRRIVQVGDRQIGIFNVHGQYYALPNFCIHQGGPLCEGRVSGTVTANAATKWEFQWGFEGEIVTCPWHGLEFNIVTGQCVALPRRQLRTYPVVVDNGQIKVVL
jgi:nitrite reductase (NADH) small subunit